MIVQWFSYFMVYAILGWIYESILCSVTSKKFINRGFLNGPYCPIYGVGAVIILLTLDDINNPIYVFILGLLLTCSLEYITSYVMEKIFHARWWDYSTKRFNINGRVCLIGGVFFGLFSVVLVLYLHPFVLNIIDRVPLLPRYITYGIIAGCFIIDNIVTISGFYGFTEKVRELSQELSNGKEKVTNKAKEYKNMLSEKLSEHEIFKKIYNIYIGKLSYQEKRMLKAFPNFKSIKYAEVVNILKHKLIKKDDNDEK